MSFKLRIKSQIDGSLMYIPSEAYDLTSTYEYYEFQYVVPENTSYVQLQVMLGENLGLYFLDAFNYDIVDTSLSVDFESHNSFILYPNPVESRLNIKSNSDIDFVRLFDNMGKFLFRIDNIENFDFGELSNGVYYLNIIFNNNSSKTKKIILN
jgi:endoglucanase